MTSPSPLSMPATPTTSFNTNRRCIFNCAAAGSTLRRFPVQDPQKCANWLKTFNVNKKYINHHGLMNLRVCSNHFAKQNDMTKCRRKVTTIRNLKTKIDTPSIMYPQSEDSKSSIQNGSSSTEPLEIEEFHTSDAESTTKSHENFQEKAVKSIIQKNMTTEGSKTSNFGNRKVFKITEKRSDFEKEEHHMYLVIEDDEKLSNVERKLSTEQQQKSKKLTLFTDQSYSHLAQKIEKVLPEIINRIQESEKKDLPISNGTTIKEKIAIKEEKPNNVALPRMPITLPPKKNRFKILDSPHLKEHLESPVLSQPKLNNLNGHTKTSNGKQINLSADFLFLMRMLPRLEKIPEPQKNHIKSNIEKLLSEPEQSSPMEY